MSKGWLAAESRDKAAVFVTAYICQCDLPIKLSIGVLSANVHNMHCIAFISFVSGAVALAANYVSLPLEKCPGYKAFNVKDSGNTLAADLKLAGKPCNTYGIDIKDLKLEVEYQTGM